MKRKVKIAKEQRNAYKDGKEQSEKRVEQLTKEVLRLQVELEKAKGGDLPPVATLGFKPSPQHAFYPLLSEVGYNQSLFE